MNILKLQKIFQDFINSRKIGNNLTRDFTKEVQFPITKIEGENKYQLQLGHEKVHCKTSSNSNNAFTIITCKDTEIHLGNTKGIMCLKTNTVLLLPFFASICFLPKFNVFACLVRDINYAMQNNAYHWYYFDLKGRFLQLEKGNFQTKIPHIAFLPDTYEIILITFPKAYHVYKILRYDLFIVRSGAKHLFGLMNHKGTFILPVVYEKLIETDTMLYVYIQKNGQVFRLDLNTLHQKQLPYNRVIDIQNHLVRVCSETKESKVPKYGIINEIGEVVLEAKYNYIDLRYTKNRFQVFYGPYTWDYEEEDLDIFYEYIFPVSSWKMYELYGKLEHGKWGIIDDKENSIVPAIYDWIDQLTEDLWLLNTGGNLYYYYDGDAKKKELAIFGGTWNVCDIHGKILLEQNVIDVETILHTYNITPIEHYANGYRLKAKIIKSVE